MDPSASNNAFPVARDEHQALVRSQEQLRALTVELTLAEQRERRRIAEGIHDQAIQALALAKMTLSSALNGMPAPNREVVESGIEIVGRAMEDLRTLVFELSPPVLYELGLGHAVEWLADQFQKRHGMVIDVRNDIPPRTIPIELRVALFQAVRELLQNVLKHAKATRVAVMLRMTRGGARVTVMDNGKGFLEEDRTDAKGFGLFNVSNRMVQMGGRFRIRSTPTRLTCAKIFVPLPHRQDRQEKDAPLSQGKFWT